MPAFLPHQRGFGRDTSPMFHYRGADVREALAGMRHAGGDPYEAIALRFISPATGGAVFPTLDYRALMLRPGETTRFKRETSSTLYIAIEGRGVTEIGATSLDWQANDIFVVPSFAWRRHINQSGADAVLYAVSDAPLMEKIGQYRAQGRLTDDAVTQLAL